MKKTRIKTGKPQPTAKPKKRAGSDVTGGMKKDNTWNVSVNTERAILEDEDAHLKVSYSPGKKGGNFGLPLGAKLVVPDGVFGKKDSITCQVAPPTQRWRHTPVLPQQEHLTSEIYIFSSTLNILKKSLVIQIPYYPIDLEHCEINVKGKWKDENEWVDVGFLKKEGTKTPCVELEVDRLGIFAVTFVPKKEVFEVTTQGCLYNAHLSKYISIRFPKKATDRNFHCTIQINPVSSDKIQMSKESCPMETSDVLQVSEFVDIIPDYDINFRRAVSVKLPLPAGFEADDETKTNDIAVLQKKGTGWEMVETNYKFTRTTVTFDVKQLSRFCIAHAKPDRKRGVYRALPVLEDRMEKERGELLVFINLQEKIWVMVLECFPLSRKEQRISERKNKGYTYIEKSKIALEEPEKKFQVRRNMFNTNTSKPKENPNFEICDRMKWDIEVQEDIKVSFESDYLDNKELQYFKYLPESYRRFIIEPKTNEEKELYGSINFVPTDINEPLAKMAATVKFKVEIDEDTVRAYFKPEFVPEDEPKPEKERPMIDLDFLNRKEEKKENQDAPKFKPLPPTVMERLMRPTRKPIIIEKESKVLSGKSLMTLSRVVPEGLTLAVHLDLPDSTITGLGFDAISNGLGMADVTYKILLYWKRQQKDKKDGAVNNLAMALRDMGRAEVANVISECHKDNKDLSAAAFSAC